MEGQEYTSSGVNLGQSGGFKRKLKGRLKETLFPDDPFRQIREEKTSRRRVLKGLQYFVPIFEWLPKYKFRLFLSDLLAGLTITSLAIPQGISYAKLANIPPIIGLCKLSLSYSCSYSYICTLSLSYSL